jgi:hypothetical protein
MLGVVVALMSAVIVLAAVAAVTVVRQRNDIRDRNANIVTLTTEVQEDRAEVAALTAQVGQLQDRLAETTGGTARLQRRLSAVQAELADIAGPALSDGRFMGRLVAVGADQQPPRVVIDLEQWFSGPAADQAALEDGMLPPGEQHVPNDSYIRNQNPRWRVVEVDPASRADLVTYPFGSIDQPYTVGLARFGAMFDRDAHSLRAFPYWIMVRDGRVVAMAEQYIP